MTSQSSNLLTSSSLLDQTALGEGVIAIPIHFVNLNEDAQPTPIQESPAPQHPLPPQLHFAKDAHQEGSFIMEKPTTIQNDVSNPSFIQSHLNSLVIKHGSNEVKSLIVNQGINEIVDSETRLIEENTTSIHSGVPDPENSLDDRQILLQIRDEGASEEFGLNNNQNDCIVSSNLLINSGDFANTKDLEGRRYTAVIVNGQVVLAPTDSEFENAVTVDSTSLNSNEPNFLSGPLMVTKLLKEKDPLGLDDRIPDSQTITISKPLKDDIDPPIGSGPWVCKKCNMSFDKWPPYKKHEKKHEEDKPFQCSECPEAFNFERNLWLHMALHSSSDHTCPECGKSFRRLASLKAHLMLHEEDEIVSCDICGEEFFSMNQLDSHKCKNVLEKVKIQYNAYDATSANATTPVTSSASNPDPVGPLLAPSDIKKEVDPGNPLPTFTCKKCGAIFQSSVLLKNHTIVHKRMKKLTATRPRRKFTDRSMFEQKCSHCGKGFLKPSQLIRHMRIHTGERPFKCTHPGCGRAFNQKGTMLIHMDIHSGMKMHTCEFCDKAFVQKSNLRGHMKRVHPSNHGSEPRLQCDECPCVFKRANSLNAHISKAHGAETVLSTDTEDIEVHTIIKQLQELEQRRKFENKPSGALCLTNKPSTEQAKERNVDFAEPEPQDENDPLQLEQDVKPRLVNDILQEAIKNSGLTQPKDHTGHEWRIDKLPPPSGSERRLQKVKLMSVVDRVGDGSIKRYPVLVRIQDDTKWHMCAFEHCRKEFKKPSDLVRHIRVHTHEKPFKCTLCPRAFSIKATLIGHMSTHNSEKKYSCEKCNKKFLTQMSLKAHRMYHKGVKPYQCLKCFKYFRTVSHHKTHLLTHSQSAHRAHTLKKKAMPLPDIPLEEPILITSQGPVKQVSRYSKVYIPEGTSDPGRPHKCRYCSAAFKKSSHAKQHERTHTGEKPYKCDCCHKTFSSTSVLRSHIKTHTGLKPYKCITCAKRFTSIGSLRRHLTTHNVTRPYMCPYCNKTFKTNSNCKKHMKIHKHELAMDAVRSAGASLQGDSEQALLTAGLYKQSQQGSASGRVVISLGDAAGEKEGTGSDAKRLHEEDPNVIVEVTGQGMINVTENPPQLDSEPINHIQATFTQDLVNGDITLTNLEKEPNLSNGVQFLAPASRPVGGHASILFPSDSSLIPGNSKIILSSIPRESSEPDSLNAILVNEDAIFDSFGSAEAPPQYIISTPSVHKLEDQTVQLSITEPISESEQPTTSIAAPQPVTSLSEFMPSYKINDAQKKYSIMHLPSGLENAPPISTSGEERHGSPSSQANAPIDTTDSSSVVAKIVTQSSLSSDSPEVLDENSSSEEENQPPPGKDLFAMNSASKSETSPAPMRGRKRKLDASIEDESCQKSPPLKKNKDFAPSEDQDGLSLPHKKARKKQVPKFQCNRCKNTYKSAVAFRNHMKFHRKPRQCKRCGGSISHKSLKEHNREQHTYKTCKLCSRTFCGEERLLSHIREVHRDIKEGQERLLIGTADKSMWRCPVCKLFFSSSDAIQKHLPSHSQEEINAGMSEDLFEQTVWAMSSHRSKRKLELTSQAVDALLYEAEVKAEDKLEISQSPRGKVPLERQDSGEFRYVCDVCGKGFKKPSDLVRHIRTHTGERPFSCKLCQKKFAVNSTLLVHMRTHTGKKEFQCPTCNAMYSSKGSLKIHMRLHTGAKPLKCQFCGLKFRTSGHRKAHIAKHFRVNNFKDLDSFKKCVLQQNQAESAAPLSEGAEKMESGSSGVIPQPCEAAGNAEEFYPLMINPDGTFTISLSSLINVGAASHNVNLQAVNLEDNIMSQLQYCNPVTLEFPDNADDAAGNSLSVDPNSIMSNQRESADAEKAEAHPAKPFNELASNGFGIASDSGPSGASHINLSDLVVVNSGNSFECSFCSLSFTKFVEWQDHLLEHGILAKDGENFYREAITNQSKGVSNVTLESNTMPKVLSNLRTPLDKGKQDSSCYAFYGDKDYDRHLDGVSAGYQCYQCRLYFASYAQLEKHAEEAHCSSAKALESRRGGEDAYSIANAEILEGADGNDKLDGGIGGPRGQSMDEDFDPLVKDIFLTS